MNTPISQTISACRSCGNASLETFFELGAQPPANSLRGDRAQALPSVPLTLCRCSRCATVQLTETVDPRYLFQHYVWVTGTSQTAQEYSRTFRDRLRVRVGRSNLFAVEVASNDGTFLRRFQEAGDKVLGVDPARNVAELAQASGVPTVADFFGQAVAQRVAAEHGKADVVYARNVLPHVPDPRDLLAGVAECLAEDGVAAIEFHQADIILRELHYDSIYHEHLFYHSLATVEYLCEQAGLHAFDLAVSPISGGSLVVYLSKQRRNASIALQTRRGAEQEAGTNTAERWHEFARASYAHREQLRDLVNAELERGSRMIGYGASARSSTLLNFCGIDHRHLLCIADRNPIKHYRWTPGTDALVVPPDEAFRLDPDAILLLAWNFKDEILGELRSRGFRGKILVPLPNDAVQLTLSSQQPSIAA